MESEETMREVKAKIGAGITIPMTGPVPTRYKAFISELKKRLTHDDPRYYKARAAGRRPPKGVKKAFMLYEVRGKNLFVPSGEYAVVAKTAEKFQYRIKWVSGVVENRSDGMAFDEMKVEMRPYQLDAIDGMFTVKRGMLIAGCGAGKTSTATAFALNSGQATIVLTHSTDLLEQWRSCFEWISGGVADVRVLAGAGKKDLSALRPGEICLATIQTLTRDPAKYKAVLLSAGVCIIDECHHASSPTWRNVINRIPARYRIGLTATPERSDDLSFVVRATIGKPFFRITSIQLVEMGYLRRPLVQPVRTRYGIDQKRHVFHTVSCMRCGTKRKDMSWTKLEEGDQRCRKCRARLTDLCKTEPGKLNFSALQTDIMSNPDRLQDIADLAMRGAMAGRKVLVLISRNEAGEKLVDRLTLLGIKAYSMTGKTKKPERERIMNKMRFGDGQVIVSAQLADEGLDISNLDLLILASGGKFAGLAAQRIGRLSRLAGADTPIMLDLVDNGNVFRRQFESRRSAYQSAYGDIVQDFCNMEQVRKGLDRLREKK